MTVTAYVKSLEGESVGTGECSSRRDYALGHIGKCLRGLERGARRILSHYTAVEKRLPHVGCKYLMVLSSLSSHHETRVVGRRGNHTENFSRSRFYRNNTTDFSFKKSFTKSLKLYVKTECQVFARHRSAVVHTILVFALDSSVGITKKDLNTFFTTKLFLVVALNTEFPDEIACLIVVVVLYV